MHALSRLPVRRHGQRRAPGATGAPGAPEGGLGPLVVSLTDPGAADPALCGRKAATLADAHDRGFPVLPGFVVTTVGASAIVAAGGAERLPAHLLAPLEEAWSVVSDNGRRDVVVRSSSPGEDGDTASMAGQFTSVLGVRGRAAFFAAVHQVIDSAAVATGAGGEQPPMAVLVQPQVFPSWGGVLFGVDPVSGRRDRLVVAAVEGGPDQLVSGVVDGARFTLSPRGRLVAGTGADGVALSARHRRALAHLAARAARAFDGPQDIEWAIDADRGLLLLQSRPITAVGPTAEARGPVLGPGPVAETFPDPLSPLEAELWLEPLRAALGEALLLTGGASRRRVASSPVVASVEGRVAADLELLGIAPPKGSFLARFDPRPPARRLWASWRTGRLRAALPALARDVVVRADRELASVGAPRLLGDGQLLAVLRGSRQVLASLNGYEVLAGMFGAGAGAGASATSAGTALQVLGSARAQGLDDATIVARHPVVLSLVPPAIGSTPSLPDVVVLAGRSDPGPLDDLAGLREALRLRVRLAQELTAVVAAELGRRLARRDLLPDAEAVRWLTLEELGAALTAGVVPDDVAGRRRAPSAPLPAAFRLAPGAAVVPVDLDAGRGDGQGAGGGRAMGRVAHLGDGVPAAGEILVVRTLEPGLAALLPGLGGLVAETGSVLSHLAILARELGLPTVVGVAGAMERFPAGSVLVVDGATGEVRDVRAEGGAA